MPAPPSVVAQAWGMLGRWLEALIAGLRPWLVGGRQMNMEGRLEGSDAPGIGFGGRGAIMGVLVLPNFADRGSTRREQGWQVVASSMAMAVAR